MFLEAIGVSDNIQREDIERRMEQWWGGNQEHSHDSGPEADTSGKRVCSSMLLYSLAQAAIVRLVKLPQKSLLLLKTVNSLRARFEPSLHLPELAHGSLNQ